MSIKENAETNAIYMQKKNAKKTPRFFMYDLHSLRMIYIAYVHSFRVAIF